MVSYKSEFEINDDGSLQKFIENAEKLAGHVEVGVLGDKTHIGGGGGKRHINMADLAAIHVFGVPSQNIPKRDFVTPVIEQNQDKYIGYIEQKVIPILQGDVSMQEVWQFIGMEAKADIQNYMVNGKFAPLSPKTIKRKGSSKPLIDTGQLRQAVSYIVVKGSK